MPEIYHALGLSMHQSLGNLLALHNSEERWEVRQILWTYDRPTRMIEGYEDVVRLNMRFQAHYLSSLKTQPSVKRFMMKLTLKTFLGAIPSPILNFWELGFITPSIP